MNKPFVFRGFPTFPALLFVFLLFLFFAGCKKETDYITQPAPAGSLIDPAIKPKVVSTYPANNAMGPFNVYTPGVYAAPYFLVQFNKLITTSSLIFGNVRCQGGTRAIITRLHGSYPQYTNAVAFDLFDSSEGLQYFYRIGVMYTVTFDTLVTDVNGNHLPQPFSFSFTPEPYFRVLQVLPMNGDTLSASETPQILFNSTFPDSFRSFVHITPPVPGAWYGGFSAPLGNPTTIFYGPTMAFSPDTTYIITVDSGAMDYQGHPLPQAFTSAFRLGSLPPFTVKLAIPQNLSTSVALNNSVFVTFTRLIDVSTVSSAVTITPHIGNGYGGFIDGFNSDPAFDLTPNTMYTVTISTALKALDSTSLAQAYSFSFQTGDFAVQFSTPTDGASGVSRSPRISQIFTGRVDTTSFPSAFSIVPGVKGHFQFGSSEVSFVPDTLLAPNTNYHVTVSTSLVNIGGYHLARAMNTSFYTGY